MVASQAAEKVGIASYTSTAQLCKGAPANFQTIPIKMRVIPKMAEGSMVPPTPSMELDDLNTMSSVMVGIQVLPVTPYNIAIPNKIKADAKAPSK